MSDNTKQGMLSIIVPVYNGKKHLDECIDSLVNQLIDSYEIILVDDGSTDGTNKIIDRCCNKFKFCKKFTQDNMGVSAARNSGIHIAKGEYIGFVDSDDTVDTEYFGKLMKAAMDNDLDIAFTDLVTFDGENKHSHELNFESNIVLGKEFTRNIIPKYMSQTNEFNSVVTKVFRRKLLTENEILFETGRKLGEDGGFCLSAFKQASSTMYIKNAGYFYRDVADSATRKSDISIYIHEIVKNYNAGRSYKNELVDDIVLKSFKEVFQLVNYIIDNSNFSLMKKYKSFRLLVNNKEIAGILKQHSKMNKEYSNRYMKYFNWHIERKNFVCIYLLKVYSRVRAGGMNE